MHPAFSVIFLTTLIGAGQGLFLAVYAVEWSARHAFGPALPGAGFFVDGAVLSVGLSALGLLASFFHLGRPERAWRSAARWRTSWLSREVIALPGFIATTALYGWAHYQGWGGTLALGGLTLIVCLALFVCTGMIYACIRFLREWASPLTLINFLLIGTASGFTLATALAAQDAPALTGLLGTSAILLTALAAAFRVASLIRNAHLVPRSTIQTAIGIKHPRIAQKSQGFMSGSFNTREFFHGQSVAFLRNVKWIFLLLGFLIPPALLLAGLIGANASWLWLAFACQYLGLIAERWFFFAQANHPQNLYYQVVS